LHIPRTAVPAVLAEFARAVRPGGGLYLSVVESDGEGFQAASKYGSNRRRRFTLHREPDLTAMLAEGGFAVRHVRRRRDQGEWLSIYARRIGEALACHQVRPQRSRKATCGHSDPRARRHLRALPAQPRSWRRQPHAALPLAKASAIAQADTLHVIRSYRATYQDWMKRFGYLVGYPRLFGEILA
jgi:hypothetical protein